LDLVEPPLSLIDGKISRRGNTCIQKIVEMDENPVPTKTNSLGVKGAGEAGNVGAPLQCERRKSRRE
jgi:hypothetical protein